MTILTLKHLETLNSDLEYFWQKRFAEGCLIQLDKNFKKL